MTSKIAFDLDGVLIPDYNFIPGLTDEEFYAQTMHAKPLFNPQYDFDIVTARFEEHRAMTEQWIQQMKTWPKNIFMLDNRKETPAEFKFRIACQQNYQVYVESDPKICIEIKLLAETNNVKLQVIHYDTWVSVSFPYLAY